jgi:hypothetical protein
MDQLSYRDMRVGKYADIKNSYLAFLNLVQIKLFLFRKSDTPNLSSTSDHVNIGNENRSIDLTDKSSSLSSIKFKDCCVYLNRLNETVGIVKRFHSKFLIVD